MVFITTILNNMNTDTKTGSGHKDFNLPTDPQKYFHAMGLAHQKLGNTSAWAVAVTIVTDYYLKCQKTDHVSKELANAYKSTGVLNLANKVLTLVEDYSGEPYIYSTLKAKGFKHYSFEQVSRRNAYVPVDGFDLTQDDCSIRLDSATFRELFKAFRFYVHESCKKMFSPREHEENWDENNAMFRPCHGASLTTNGTFCLFAGSLLDITRSLSSFTTTLSELDTIDKAIRTASDKNYEEKRLANYERKKTERERERERERELELEREEEERGVDRDRNRERERERERERVKRIPAVFAPAPANAWKTGNPLIPDAVARNTPVQPQTEKLEEKEKEKEKTTKKKHVQKQESKQEPSHESKQEPKQEPRHEQVCRDNESSKGDDGNWIPVKYSREKKVKVEETKGKKVQKHSFQRRALR